MSQTPISSEVSIVLPLYSNEGKSLKHEVSDLCHEILDVVGGYTATAVVGQWKDKDGTVYTDRSLKVSTVVTSHSELAALHAIAEKARTTLRQETIFLQSSDVVAEFIGEETSSIPPNEHRCGFCGQWIDESIQPENESVQA